ncbi:hypothetical protein HPP92_026802 [Vanilla planifolia]|uniref:Uncharacterized protein n=1 Tax=Vanilla planifolia TaxID=51239 RepID=A0A835UV28_VANPL|nr:hypothetical protein HPP92_026802 [Vanilla planifolia]KAG0473545.1 hypothetical protein HPP92_015402 [Vanilla planifolia]
MAKIELFIEAFDQGCKSLDQECLMVEVEIHVALLQSMESSLSIKYILFLDSEGRRVSVKLAFEKSVLSRLRKRMLVLKLR